MQRTTLLIAFVIMVFVLSPGAAAHADAPVKSVVVVGIGGLRWDDVNNEDTPNLTKLGREGAVGSLSVRSAPQVTCPGEGWLTIGAGNYAALKRAEDTNPCAKRQPPEPVPNGTGARITDFDKIRDLNRSLRFGARPGALASSLGCASAIGPGAATAAANGDGNVSEYRQSGISADCPLTVADLGTLPEGDKRADAVRAADAALGAMAEARPDDSVIMVLGQSESDAAQGHLHVAVANGPGFNSGWLESASTRRLPYVQLVDVAPTVLTLLNREVPDSMVGQPWRDGGAGRSESWPATVDTLADTDAAATAHGAVTPSFFIVYGLLALIVYAAAIVFVRRRSPAPFVAAATAVLAAFPAASFVANLLPWWDAPGGVVGMAGTLIGASWAIALVIGLLTIAVYQHRGATAALVTVSGIGVVVLSLDLLTGSNMQLNSMMGTNNALNAGRFAGMGGTGYAVFASISVLLAAALATGHRRSVAIAWVAAVSIPVTVLIGLPAFGVKFGGVLANIPTFVVLGLLVSRLRVTVARLVLASLAAAVVVGAISAADYLRPAPERSHFGRFVGSVLDGSGLEIVRRKAEANLDLLLTGPHTLLAFVGVIAVGVVVFRPPAVMRAAYEHFAPLRPALIALVTLGIVGFLTNDSGIAIPLIAALIALPVVFAACLLTPREQQDAGDPNEATGISATTSGSNPHHG